MDYLSLGPVPAEEDCAQVGSRYYLARARTECLRYIELIRSRLGAEPEGARLRIIKNPNDFGDYLDVVVEYNASIEAAVNYAFRAEKDAPTRWED